jgi:hypothetical protein
MIVAKGCEALNTLVGRRWEPLASPLECPDVEGAATRVAAVVAFHGQDRSDYLASSQFCSAVHRP